MVNSPPPPAATTLVEPNSGNTGTALAFVAAAKGMKGAIEKAQEIVATTPGAISPRQFDNPENPDIDRRTAIAPPNAFN